MQFNKTLLTAALFAFGSLSANAADTAQFKVYLNIDSICNVTSAVGTNDINLGTKVAGATFTEGSQTTPIQVACSKTTAYDVKLAGSGNLVGVLPATESIAYELRNVTGGAALSTSDIAFSGTGTGLTNQFDHTVFAAVTGSTDVAPGQYEDIVTATVTY